MPLSINITLILLLLLSLLVIVFLIYKSRKIIKIKNDEIFKLQQRKIESAKAPIYLPDKANQPPSPFTEAIGNANILKKLLPKKEKILKSYFSDYFIFDKPKEHYIGGDFLLIEEVEGKLFFGVIDSLGHGINGFLFVLYFQYIISETFQDIRGNVSLGNFLQTLEKKLKDITKRTEKEQYYLALGFDFDICCWDKSQNYVEYCSNSRHLYHLSNDSLQEIQSNRKRLIVSHDEILLERQQNRQFIIAKMYIKKGDMIYITSDGYIDQFGGDVGKKFIPKRFIKIIEGNHHLSLLEQKKVFADTIENWQTMGEKKYEQRDDILVLGLKI